MIYQSSKVIILNSVIVCQNIIVIIYIYVTYCNIENYYKLLIYLLILIILVYN